MRSAPPSSHYNAVQVGTRDYHRLHWSYAERAMPTHPLAVETACLLCASQIAFTQAQTFLLVFRVQRHGGGGGGMGRKQQPDATCEGNNG